MQLFGLAEMFSGNDGLANAVASAKERDLLPLLEEGIEAIGLDRGRLPALEAHLNEAWFFGVRTGHAVMLETKMGQSDPRPVILGMQNEFQELMERLAEALDTTVGKTIQAWDLLGRAWIGGSRFWEVEITARLIESRSDDLEEALRRLQE